MKTWLQQHRHAARNALARLAASPVGTFLSALVIGIALALPAGGHVALQSFLGLARDISGTPQISLFMRLAATKDHVSDVQSKLTGHPDIARVEYISREDAFKRLHAAEGLGAVLDALPRNPFPEAFVITPLSKDPAVFSRLEAEFSTLPKVEHVQIDSSWVQRLHAMLSFGELMVILIAGLLGGALVVVTFNTIRLQIVTHRAEIEISRLLGATDSFVRRPLYWFGALQGLFGGVLAWVIVSVVLVALSAPAHAMAGAWGLDFTLRGLDLPAGLALLTFSASLGWIGAAISLRQYLGRI